MAYAAGPRPEDIRTATAAEMLTALAGALGLEQTDDLARYTAAQPTLLLLDNLESLPPGELARLGNFLRQLGRESAALLALRPSQKTLEDLPAARPMPLHSGLAEGEAARYAMFLARQRKIPLTQEQARLIARAVDGHPLLVEQLVAQARRRDLDDLLREISERHGDFAALLETVYSWSASRLDEAGLAAWAALTLFPAGCAPEGPLRTAAGEAGLQNLRECALADFDAAGQFWRWHATVAEYALGHWPLSEEEWRTRQVSLLPAWTRWLERQPAGDRRTLNRLEESRPNLDAVLDACTEASYEEVWSFLDGLDACLPNPERTLTLRRLVARVWKAKLLVLPAGEEARRAGLLNNLSIALFALGRREDALAPSQESVAIRRKLAASNPQAFLPNLAASLNNLGNLLSALGRHEDALAPSQESVAIRRKLAASNPLAFLPDLAMSLNNLGLRLSALGRHEDALAPSQEASDLCRKLAASNPLAILPYLAMTLNNLGNRLSALGRHEDALAPSQEASDLYRKLAASNPQAFLPNLATSLGSYGSILQDLERDARAAQAFAEGLQHLAPFYRDLPQAFTGPAKGLVQGYRQACQKAGLVPDAALLSQFS